MDRSSTSVSPSCQHPTTSTAAWKVGVQQAMRLKREGPTPRSGHDDVRRCVLLLRSGSLLPVAGSPAMAKASNWSQPGGTKRELKNRGDGRHRQWTSMTLSVPVRYGRTAPSRSPMKGMSPTSSTAMKVRVLPSERITSATYLPRDSCGQGRLRNDYIRLAFIAHRRITIR